MPCELTVIGRALKAVEVLIRTTDYDEDGCPLVDGEAFEKLKAAFDDAQIGGTA